ncbi:VirD4-like conjugal transfer protein, CD1115 family [Ruminococcus sp.]|uniref:VirD4-like conjugal transfer protein, CD1115 family n=1 Tax=Ruminococcus sp. TaxID=41978 RepID=UPI0025D92584|nr:type IV secretory system conjugative DNA transfer family protein [Ruminococcus sp.]
MENEHKVLSAIARVLLLISLTSAMVVLVCFALNVLDELLAVNKAAVADQNNAGAIWASFSIRKEFLWTKPKNFKISDLIFLSFILSVLLFAKITRQIEINRGYKDLEGSDRWASKRELNKNLIKIQENNLEKAEQTGPLIACKYGYFYVDPKNNHSLIIGTTGSGKTQTHVLQQARVFACGKDKQSIIFNDPKGEIFSSTYPIMKKENYNVVILNLRDTNRSSRWNPLTFIINEYVYCRKNNIDLSKVSEYIDTMASTLTYNPKSDPIWPSSAKSLLSALILYMIEQGYDNDQLDKVNMHSVYQFFIEYGQETEETDAFGNIITKNRLDEIFKGLPVGSLAKAAYATSNFAKGDMRASIFATLADNIRIFGLDTGIAQLTSGNDIDLDALVNSEKPFVIYMIIPDDRPTRHVIASMFINQSYLSMVEYLTKSGKSTLNRRVNYVLDEFCNLVTIPGMDNKITVSRSRNIGWHLYIQGLNQLDSKYPDDSKTIRENCANWVYIYSGDPDTNQFISNILGSRTVQYKTYSGKLSEELSENRAYKGKQLKTPTELSVLKEGETIVKHHRMYPIESNFKFFYKLKLETAELDEITFSSDRVPLSETLFPFKYLEPNSREKIKAIADKDAHLSEKNSTPPNESSQLAKDAPSAVPNRFVNSPESVIISPQKAALEAINQATNGEWSRAMQEIDIEALERLLNRAKIKNRSTITDEQFEMLSNMILRKKQQTVLSNIM